MKPFESKQYAPFVLSLGLLFCAYAAAADTPEDSSAQNRGGSANVELAQAMKTGFVELVDPTPGAGEGYGSRMSVNNREMGFAVAVTILSNGNIVAIDPKDSKTASSAGAVHLYDKKSGKLISSIYGDNINDRIGSGGITALPNGNYVIISPDDDIGTISDAGSVTLMNGTTGAEISSLNGSNKDDSLGYGGVIPLSDSSFVVLSPKVDNHGLVDSGLILLVSGNKRR
jgi:hypothetical protein